MVENKILGFKIDDYFVSFPEGEIINEEEDGQMSIIVDIYKMDKDNNRVSVPKHEITEDLELKIAAHINQILTTALEQEKQQHEQN
jgi:hypothetical protein